MSNNRLNWLRFLVAPVVVMGVTRAHGICVMPVREDYSRGDYKIESIETAKIPCEPKSTGGTAEQVGPGCFVKLRKISPNEKLLSQDSELRLYSTSDTCRLKKDSVVKKELTSWCCIEDVSNVTTCGSIKKETTVCFIPKTYYETSGIDEELQNLNEVDEILERLHKQSK